MDIEEKLKRLIGDKNSRVSKLMNFVDLFGQPVTVDTGSADGDRALMEAIYGFVA